MARRPAATDPTISAGDSGYAPVNGLQMYYEVHGGGSGRPLVLLHGNLSTIGVDFGGIIPSLAKSRQVIGVEQQAHGHTADIDRPLSIQNWTSDTVALLRHLGIGQADLFGYSSGSAVAMQLTLDHPELVGKLVLASASYRLDGLHPGPGGRISEVKPEHLAGTPFEQDYARVAPNPGDWPRLIEKITQMDADLPQWSADEVRAIAAPTMLIIGDSDIVQPEHAVEMFRLLGGGVIGDLVGLPRARLAVLPGTTHVTLVQRTDWLSSMVGEFLDAESGEPGQLRISVAGRLPAQLVQYRWIAQMAACRSCSHGQQRAQVPGITVPQSGQARSPRSARQAGQEQGWRGSGAHACKWRPPGRGAGHPCQLVLTAPSIGRSRPAIPGSRGELCRNGRGRPVDAASPGIRRGWVVARWGRRAPEASQAAPWRRSVASWRLLR